MNPIVSNGNLWKTIADDIGVDIAAKDAIKKAFYTLQYGGELSTVKAELTKGMNRAGYYVSTDAFVNHWIVTSMYDGRERYLADMRANNGAMSYYGVWYSLDDYDAKSILSHIASSYELALIRPLFDIASESDDFQIVLYQFDGISISITQQKETSRILKRLTDAVNITAANMGFNTRLEYELI